MHPVLSVEMPPWLYAKTHRALGVTGLIVYRSVAVRDSDQAFGPVRKTLDEHDWTRMEREDVETKDMMFGLAELGLYALTSELAALAVEMVSVFVDELKVEARRFLEL